MTRKEKIVILKDIIAGEIIHPQVRKDVGEWAIKALEQEPVIDKIRAEIEKAVWEDAIVSLDGTDEVRIPRLDPDDVFEIIDEYKAESEE